MVSQRVRQLNEHGFEDGKEFRQRDGGKNMTKNGDKKIRPGSNARLEVLAEQESSALIAR